MTNPKKPGAVLFVLLLCSSALAAEITFQVSEIDLGQDAAVNTPLAGDEWLPFGIEMVGGDLLLYGPGLVVDPFPPPADNNGLFDPFADFEIVFTSAVTGLEVDWWTPNVPDITLRTFDADDNPLEVMTHSPGEASGTDLFAGEVKRLVVEADPPGTTCIANLRFNVTSVPSSSTWSILLMLGLLASGIAWVVSRLT